MLFYHSYNQKHKSMVAILSQYCFGVEKAVQISQAVFLIKEHNPNFNTKTSKPPYKSGYQLVIMNGFFGFKFSENFNIALLSMHTKQIFICLEVLTFKMVIKVSA